MTSAVAIRELRKTYPGTRRTGPNHALKGVTLDVPEGSFFGLLGPNGAGKSTLINIMAGLTVKSSGSVEIRGHDIDLDMRAARCSIGVVPQELVLDTFFTVREALEIHAGYYGVPKAARRTDAIISAMGLTDKADINSRRLSGGMRRRLLIAKALVHNPPVLILDEPTAGVDVELRQQLWAYVKELNRQGTTILLTTHYLEEAEELCDRIAIINHGEVVANDSTQNLLHRIDSKQLVIKLSQPLSYLPESLTESGAELDEQGNLVLNYKPSEIGFETVLKRVKDAGLEICDLTTHEADLEDIFRQLTRKEDAA